MLKIYIPKVIPGVRMVPFLADRQKGKRLFQDIDPALYQDLFTKVDSIEEAELVIVPHEYPSIRGKVEYVNHCLHEARAAHKRILFSAYQDDPEPLPLPEEAIILRPSAFRSKLRPNEHIMPAYVEDLGAKHGFEPIEKGKAPTVGFAGKAGFANSKEAIRYALRNYVFRSGPEREGIYFRRQAIRLLTKSPSVDFRVIKRRRYSGHRNTIELPPEEARRQYVDSIRNAQFTLAPRGDGNYSLRFYETLSLGRLPILIDTDMRLPFEDIVPYDDFVLRVHWTELSKLPDIVAGFYTKYTDEELQEKQRAAHQAFEQHLFMPTFLKTLFAGTYLGIK